MVCEGESSRVCRCFAEGESELNEREVGERERGRREKEEEEDEDREGQPREGERWTPEDGDGREKVIER